MYRSRRSRVAAATLLFPLLPSTVVHADDAFVPLPPIVVTATRSPLAISRAGSAIDVIEHEDIERLGSTGLRDVLQSVPGLFIHESGGVGTASNVTLRGSTPGQTLVLVDGIRLGDPTSTDNAVDLGSIAVTDIERIEVLRGPQSALYGSDAMGGVIQIITRRGAGPPRKSVTLEGGSYGTLHTRASISGGTDVVSYAFSVDALHADGFPRYGYRRNHPIFLSDGVTPLPPLPTADPTNRAGMTGRVTYTLGETSTFEFGFAGNGNRISFDNPYAALPENVFSTYNLTKEWNGRVYSRIASDMFDGSLHNQLTLFGTALDNAISQTESCPDFFSNCRTNYRGVRVGAEYQGDLKLGGFGALTVGARNETERAFQSVDQPVALGGHLGLFSQQQTTNSVFALHQVTLADRLDLSVAGRVDSVVEGRTFTTGRATAAWRFSDDSGKVRASVGTGAKIPSLYQRYSTYGFAGLAPEENIGFDVGIDQPILGERFLLSATFFNNRYTNLIQFSLAPSCGPAQIFGCYYNVGKAATQGLELSAKADIAPGEWRATASYTYMDAIDKITSNGLLQRPRHKAVGSLIYTGVPDLRLEGRMTVVAGVLDFGNFAPVQLPAYYRLDAYADYKVDKNLSVFARLENLTNARYVEVYNYGVAGRSLYAGLKVDW